MVDAWRRKRVTESGIIVDEILIEEYDHSEPVQLFKGVNGCYISEFGKKYRKDDVNIYNPDW